MNRYYMYILHLYTDRPHQDIFLEMYGGSLGVDDIALNRIRSWEKEIGIRIDSTGDYKITIELIP